MLELSPFLQLIALSFFCRVEGFAHPKIEILSSFTHHQVIPNLYDLFFLFLAWQKEHLIPSLCESAVKFQNIKKASWTYIMGLFVPERKKVTWYRMTWGWVNYYRIFISSWTGLLNSDGRGKSNPGCQFLQILCDILVFLLSLHTLSFPFWLGVEDCTRTTEQSWTDLYVNGYDMS